MLCCSNVVMGSMGGTVVRALASHQIGPGSNPGVDAICGLSLLLVLSRAPRGFSPGTPVFPSPQKPTFPNSNSTRNQVDEEPLCGCATCKSLFIYYYLFMYHMTRPMQEYSSYKLGRIYALVLRIKQMFNSLWHIRGWICQIWKKNTSLCILTWCTIGKQTKRNISANDKLNSLQTVFSLQNLFTTPTVFPRA